MSVSLPKEIELYGRRALAHLKRVLRGQDNINLPTFRNAKKIVNMFPSSELGGFLAEYIRRVNISVFDGESRGRPRQAPTYGVGKRVTWTLPHDTYLWLEQLAANTRESSRNLAVRYIEEGLRRHVLEYEPPQKNRIVESLRHQMMRGLALEDDPAIDTMREEIEESEELQDANLGEQEES